MGKTVLQNLDGESCGKVPGGEWIEEIEACVVETDSIPQSTVDALSKNRNVNMQLNYFDLDGYLETPEEVKEESSWIEKIKPDEIEAGFPTGVKCKWKG